MTRSRASARQAGSTFERRIADHLRDNWDDRIDRRVKTGARDCGDIANFRIRHHKITVECKDQSRVDLAGWVKEVQQEAINDGALTGIVVAKRKGKGDPGQQWVILTVDDLLRLLGAALGEHDTATG